MDEIPMNKAAKGIFIRDFRKSDLDSILKLLSLCFTREFELLGLDANRLRGRVEPIFGLAGKFLLFLLRIFGKEPFRFFVAEVGGNVVGTILITRQGKVGYISTVMVHPDYRRRGIAKMLLQRAVDYIQRGGMERAVLHVDSSNAPAKSLYTKLGFKVFEKMAYLVANVSTASYIKPKDVYIRNFQQSDVDSVYELIKSCEDPEHLKIFDFKKEDLKSSFLNRLLNVFDEAKIVAVCKNKVVGYVNVVRPAGTVTPQILNICSLPENSIEEFIIQAGIDIAARKFNAKKIVATISLRRQKMLSAIKRYGFDQKFVIEGMVLEDYRKGSGL